MKALVGAAIVALFCQAGCGSSPGSRDADTDGDMDAGADGDGVADTDMDAGVDGDVNTDKDSGLWPWCPGPEEYLGGGWTSGALLKVANDARYCFNIGTNQNLDEQMTGKIQVRVVAGEYPVPAESGNFEVRLPVCTRTAKPEDQLRLDAPGSLTFEGDAEGFNMRLCQPLRTEAGELYYLSLATNGQRPQDGVLYLKEDSLGAYTDWQASVSRDCDQEDIKLLQPCTWSWIDPLTTPVRFEGGTIELEIHIGWPQGAMFGAFTRAAGTLDGQSFEQENYWKLAFNSWWHFFSCDYIVLFDESIGEACGLKILQLATEGRPPDPDQRLTTIRCDLTEIEERAILEP